MFAHHVCDFRLDYEAVARTPLHVGSGDHGLRACRPQGESKARQPADYEVRLATSSDDATAGHGTAEVVLPLHFVIHDGSGDRELCWLVPGTSLRGVARAFLRSLLDRATGGETLAPAWEEEGPPEVGEDGEPLPPAREAFGHPLVRHLFGSTNRRGAITFSDLALSSPNRGGAGLRATYSDMAPLPVATGGYRSEVDADLRLLVHNRLDRWSHASTPGLRTLAALEAGTRLEGHVLIRNFSWWQVGLLAHLLEAFERGDIGVGGRGAVGLGRLTLQPRRIVIRYHRAARVRPPTFPGAGILLDPEDDRAWGRIRRGEAAWQLFVRDPDDRLQIPGLTSRERRPSSVGLMYRTWTFEGRDLQERLLRPAARRLRAVAATLGDPDPALLSGGDPCST